MPELKKSGQPEVLPLGATGDPEARLVTLILSDGTGVSVWLRPENFHSWGREPGRTYVYGNARWFVTLNGQLKAVPH